MSIVIYHNPQCGTSRNVLEIIRGFAEEPIVVEYLKTGWTRNRPIVCTRKGVALCRPSEAVFALLPDVVSGSTFTKEDGDVITAP